MLPWKNESITWMAFSSFKYSLVYKPYILVWSKIGKKSTFQKTLQIISTSFFKKILLSVIGFFQNLIAKIN